jgi:hypothetical protein
VFTARYGWEVRTHTSRLIFRFPLPVSFHRCPIFISLYMLRFSEGQMGEDVLCRISGSSGRKSAFLPPPLLSLEVTFGNETHMFLHNKVPHNPQWLFSLQSAHRPPVCTWLAECRTCLILSQNCARSKHNSYRILRMIILTTLDKIKPNPENIRTLNVATVKVNNGTND